MHSSLIRTAVDMNRKPPRQRFAEGNKMAIYALYEVAKVKKCHERHDMKV
jgi:hypothetical protein